LQEETIKDAPKKEFKREPNSGFRYSGRSCSASFSNSGRSGSSMSYKNVDGSHLVTRRVLIVIESHLLKIRLLLYELQKG
jgi:hypothetical protein